MPELRLREVRLPELRLPEMSRDDIARAIGDARRDVDLTRFDPRRIDRSDADVRRVELPDFDLSKVDLSKVDLPKAIAAAGQAVGIGRRQSRPRWPFVLGGVITLTLVGIAVLNSPAVKPRLAEAARRWKDRMEARRDERLGMTASVDEGSPMVEPDTAEAPSLAPDYAPGVETAAIGVPIEPDAYASAPEPDVEPVGATEAMPSSGNGREPALEADTVDPEVTSETRSA
jgi:hypothetical protein